jgi:hypothetical protein
MDVFIPILTNKKIKSPKYCISCLKAFRKSSKKSHKLSNKFLLNNYYVQALGFKPKNSHFPCSAKLHL